MATVDAEYGDVLFHNSVHWLSRGAVLEKFVVLLPQIISFLKENGRPVAKLDTQFQIRLCALAVICGHLNKLFKKSKSCCVICTKQQRGLTASCLFSKFMQRTATSCNELHFRFTREVCDDDKARTEDATPVLVAVLDSLQTAFKERFVDFASVDDVFFDSPSQSDVCCKRWESTKLRCMRISSISKLCRA